MLHSDAASHPILRLGCHLERSERSLSIFNLHCWWLMHFGFSLLFRWKEAKIFSFCLASVQKRLNFSSIAIWSKRCFTPRSSYALFVGSTIASWTNGALILVISLFSFQSKSYCWTILNLKSTLFFQRVSTLWWNNRSRLPKHKITN